MYVPVLIKIDVEGHERSVLRADRTLADARLLRQMITRVPGISDSELVWLMLEHGFSAYGYDPFNRQLVDASQTDGNTVFVRDPAAVERGSRIQALPAGHGTI